MPFVPNPEWTRVSRGVLVDRPLYELSLADEKAWEAWLDHHGLGDVPIVAGAFSLLCVHEDRIQFEVENPDGGRPIHRT